MKDLDRRFFSPRVRRVDLFLTLALCPLALLPGGVQAADYTVTTTSDSGSGSLRAAITNANANASSGVADKITFAIPATDTGCTAGTCTIGLASTLPAITDTAGLTIDGQGSTIVLDGKGAVRIMEVNISAKLTLEHLTLSSGNNSNGGGAIFSNGTLIVSTSTFSGNRGFGSGGAIASGGILEITRSSFFGNLSAVGGAIASGGTLTVNASTFSGNTTFEFGSGGAIFVNAGTGTITDSIFNGNHGDKGGAILAGDGPKIPFRGGQIALLNCTFSENTAGGVFGLGGAVYSQGNLTMTNSTVFNNTADIGGGLYLPSSTAVYTVNNTIVAGNHALGTTPFPDIHGTVTSGKHNLISDAGSAGGLTNGTAGNIVGVADLTTVLNATLADNGGPTKTHALVPGGPAVNAGDNALAVDADGIALATDQRGKGFARIDCVAPNNVDIGAFEVQQNCPPAAQCKKAIKRDADNLCQASITAADVDDGSSDPNGDPLTLTLTPSGPFSPKFTNVTLTVSDGKLSSSCTTSVEVTDVTPPTLGCDGLKDLPPTNATSPAGASITFPTPPLNTATDNCTKPPAIVCAPLSGSTFAPGTTPVSCRAKDAASNVSSNTCTFQVTVIGAPGQLTALTTAVNTLDGVKTATKTSLVVKLAAAQKALSAGDKATACSALQDFINLANAQAGKKQLTATQAADLVRSATQIRAVLGCG